MDAAELCHIVRGQLYWRKLSEDQTRRTTACGAVKPADNARRIAGMISKVLGLNSQDAKDAKDDNLSAYGLEL